MGDSGNTDSGTTGSSSTGSAGWHPDPRARFELRYHNGVAWTADVSTGGERFVDPLGNRPAPPGLVPPPPPGKTVLPPSGSDAKNSIATAAMVLGIVAICVGWMPFVVVLGFLSAVLAIIFGFKGRKRAAAGQGAGAGFALAGIIMGAVGLLVCVGGVIFSVSLVRAIDRFENPAEHEAAITSCILDNGDLTATGTITNASDAATSFTVRVSFVRQGTDNARRQANVLVDDVGSGETREFEVSRQIGDVGPDLDCIIGAVRGPLPYGADPGT